MKMSKNKKILLAVCLVLILFVGIGTTVALVLTETDEIKNVFKASKAEIAVEEDIIKDGGKDIKTNVCVKNTGDTDVYVRADVVISWKDSAGNIYSAVPVKDTDYKISLGTDWQKHSDGIYYYNTALTAKSESTPLIVRCEKLGRPADVPAEYDLSVEILAEGIQTNGAADAWGVVPPIA